MSLAESGCTTTACAHVGAPTLTRRPGGPEVLTRREIFEMVAARAGRRVRIGGMPTWMASISAGIARVMHPRIGQFMQFAVGLAKHDVIAPALGTTRFVDYLMESPDVVGRRTAA